MSNEKSPLKDPFASSPKGGGKQGSSPEKSPLKDPFASPSSKQNKVSPKQLAESKAEADTALAKKGKAGGAGTPCQDEKSRWLTVQWSTNEGYCADEVFLNGAAAGIQSKVTASAQVNIKEGKTETSVVGLSGDGQSTFKIPWKVCDVSFAAKKGTPSPLKKPAIGTLSADGMSATTPAALAVKRLPDNGPETVSFSRSSPKTANGVTDFGWTAAFKVSVKDTQINVRQTLQLKKGWLGKKVAFDPKSDKVKQSHGWIKQDGDWKYYDFSTNAWAKLPRDLKVYTVTSHVFVESGSKFVMRENSAFEWPEPFVEPTNLDDKKKVWLKGIHDVWGDRFLLAHKKCKDHAPGLCQWNIEIRVNWSEAAGDKLVYAVWAQSPLERSDSTDWYLGDSRTVVGAHECGHLLGAYDEYGGAKGGALDPGTKLIDKDSIMGSNLSDAHPRHMDGLRDEMKKKIQSWIGRSWELEVRKR